MLRKPWLIIGTAATLVIFFYVTPTDGVHFFWEKLSVFNLLFGFFGTIFLIFVPRILGRLFVRKKEDYYD